MNKSTVSVNQKIKNNLSYGWTNSTVGDISNVIRGISFPKDSKLTHFKDGYIACLRTTNIQKDVEWDDLWFVPERLLRRMEQIVRINDILISSANSLQLVGKVAQVNNIPFKATIGAFISMIRVYEFIDARFIYYQLSSSEIQSFFRGIASTTTNISNLSNSDILLTKIRIAPINEQKLIVAKIEELFTKLHAGIKALKKTQLLLKQFRRSVLKYAFEGKLTEKWRKGADIIQSPLLLIDKIKQIKDDIKERKHIKLTKQELLQIPKDWIWIQISNITQSMKNGIYKPPRFYNQNGIACLRMYNIERGKIVWKDIKRMNLRNDEVKEYELLPGDILVNRVNSRELVGKAAVIPNGLEPCVYESKNIRLRLFNQYINSKLVSLWILLCGQKYFDTNAQQTVGMASINQIQLGSMPIPLMSIEEQTIIVDTIEKHFSIIENNEMNVKNSLVKSETLRQSILRNAFEGKLVPQDSTDEPAEILLKRIKQDKVNSEIHSVPNKTKIKHDGKQRRLI